MKFSRVAFIAFVAVVILLPLAPLASPGTLHQFDMILHLERIVAFYRSIQEGNIPPTWSTYLSYGLGSPVLIYNWSFPYYLASMFISFGSTLVDTYKWITALSYIGAFVMMFVLLVSVSSVIPAIVGAVWYIWAPYRFNINHLRGAIGEEFAFVFWPGVFWATLFFFRKKYRIGFLAGSLMWALLIWSHTPLFGMIIPLWLLFTLLESLHTRNIRAGVSAVFSMIFGMGLVSYSWIPILFERSYLAYYLHEMIFRDNFVSWEQLLSQPYVMDFGLTYQRFYAIGWPIIGIGILTVLVLANRIGKKWSLLNTYQLLFLSMGFIGIVMVRPASTVLWTYTPLLAATINFPQRFLGLVAFCGSVLSALFVAQIKKGNPLVAAILAILVIIALDYPFVTLNTIREPDLSVLNSPVLTTTDVWGEFRPRNAPLDIKDNHSYYEKLPMVTVSPALSNIPSCIQDSIAVTCRINTTGPGRVTIRQFYFPGWTARADGNILPIQTGPNGLIQLNIPRAANTITIRYVGTPVANTAKILSMVSFFCYLFLVGKTLYTGYRAIRS